MCRTTFIQKSLCALFPMDTLHRDQDNLTEARTNVRYFFHTPLIYVTYQKVGSKSLSIPKFSDEPNKAPFELLIRSSEFLDSLWFFCSCHSRISSVILDIPPREISCFADGSSPEISMKDVGDRMESTQTTFTGATATLDPKSSILQTTRRNTSTSKNKNHVKFVTPTSTLHVSHTMEVDLVLHQLATCAAEFMGADINCKVLTKWRIATHPEKRNRDRTRFRIT
ncbi:hypothetical protein AVEN_231959-1 [Araneus ventricosus]|uniref:Uncharacterized protein n=1 Tax=Araneus ventricosus TaxID=182803 RepID=A0A4Y2C135_ARAVE|nr:hypothetical protein AVEN_231959-1 [Araneus ventricosus]